jgi:hypothetical protein
MPPPRPEVSVLSHVVRLIGRTPEFPRKRFMEWTLRLIKPPSLPLLVQDQKSNSGFFIAITEQDPFRGGCLSLASKGSRVPHNKHGLTVREYYILGGLAEPSARRPKDLHRYTAEAERLVQREYLERVATGGPGGEQVSLYRITHKGRMAWQAYRFPAPLIR